MAHVWLCGTSWHGASPIGKLSANLRYAAGALRVNVGPGLSLHGGAVRVYEGAVRGYMQHMMSRRQS